VGVEQYNQKIIDLYHIYSKEFKPWLATVETKYQEFPAEILNELRAFTDHISRCYADGISDEGIERNIERAENHLSRATFDCVKTLVLAYFDDVANFEDTTKDVDLSLVQNGVFYVKYRQLKQKAEENVRRGKEVEKDDTIEDYRDVSFEHFQNAFNTYKLLGEHINKNLVHVDWARRKKNKKKAMLFFAWIGSAIISGIISVIFGPQVIELSKKLLEWIGII